MLPMIEKLLGWEKENYLRDLILKIIKRPPLSTFTQLIKRKLLLLSADGEFNT